MENDCDVRLGNRESSSDCDVRYVERLTLNDTIFPIDNRLTSHEETMVDKKPIRSFRDLDVYQNTYRIMIIVIKEIIPKLPESEKYDLKDQLSRSAKAIPRLIAEGSGKRHQKLGFQKYIDDAISECNETVVSLEQCRDLYDVDKNLIDGLVDDYDKSARQLYNLRKAWTNFKIRET